MRQLTIGKLARNVALWSPEAKVVTRCDADVAKDFAILAAKRTRIGEHALAP